LAETCASLSWVSFSTDIPAEVEGWCLGDDVVVATAEAVPNAINAGVVNPINLYKLFIEVLNLTCMIKIYLTRVNYPSIYISKH
jgi:hypothetical protein